METPIPSKEKHICCVQWTATSYHKATILSKEKLISLYTCFTLSWSTCSFSIHVIFPPVLKCAQSMIGFFFVSSKKTFVTCSIQLLLIIHKNEQKTQNSETYYIILCDMPNGVNQCFSTDGSSGPRGRFLILQGYCGVLAMIWEFTW